VLLPARSHWPCYLTEVAGTACFVVGSGLATLLAEHPASPVAQALHGLPTTRRAVIAALVVLVVCAITYNPWGRRSGALLNPAMTLGFWQLGRIGAADALAYAAAQVAGATVGALLLHAAMGRWLMHPAVHQFLTQPRPGPGGTGLAWAAEFVITGGFMLLLLQALHSPRLRKATGVLAALLLAVYIVLESPLSGMSLNPARSLGTALAAGEFRGLWVYWTAPPLAAWLAVLAWKRSRGQPLAQAMRRGPGPALPGDATPPTYPALRPVSQARTDPAGSNCSFRPIAHLLLRAAATWPLPGLGVLVLPAGPTPHLAGYPLHTTLGVEVAPPGAARYAATATVEEITRDDAPDGPTRALLLDITEAELLPPGTEIWLTAPAAPQGRALTK